MNEPTKVCTKCGVKYPATREYFHAQKLGKYGLISMCRKCNNERRKKYREENPEKEKAYNKKYCEENLEKEKSRRKKYSAENIEKIKASLKKWRAANPEKALLNYTRRNIKRQIGATPPPELVEIKVLINKTKKLCKTLNS